MLLRHVGLFYCEVKRSNDQRHLTKAFDQIKRIQELVNILSQANLGCTLPCVKVAAILMIRIILGPQQGRSAGRYLNIQLHTRKFKCFLGS